MPLSTKPLSPKPLGGIAELRAKLAEQEAQTQLWQQLLLEAHHRMKNDLQRVQTLLRLQARASDQPAVISALAEAGARVNAIGAIHDRLAVGVAPRAAGPDTALQLADYLAGLVEDLGAGMLIQNGRRIEFSTDRAMWPAMGVPAIGLVLTELVTNALKHGAGTIRVAFRAAEHAAATLVVEDEGIGLPAEFDPARPQPGRAMGLGMRLILGLLGSSGGNLAVDHAAGHTRFIATLPVPPMS